MRQNHCRTEPQGAKFYDFPVDFDQGPFGRCLGLPEVPKRLAGRAVASGLLCSAPGALRGVSGAIWGALGTLVWNALGRAWDAPIRV